MPGIPGGRRGQCDSLCPEISKEPTRSAKGARFRHSLSDWTGKCRACVSREVQGYGQAVGFEGKGLTDRTLQQQLSSIS